MSLNINVLNVILNLMTNPHAWLLSDLKKIPKNGLKVFSTFSCGGGSSLGYKLAGFDVIGANDIDPEMAYHYKLNHNPKHYFLCPIKDLLIKELPEELFNLDILDGSPPCSSFSMSGNREKDWGNKKHFREGQTAQVLDDLFFDYLALVDRLKPIVFIAENVKGLITGKAKGYVKEIFNKSKEIGYNPQLFLINSADCGVPQKRERVFFIALRNDIEKPKLILNPQHRWISAKEAISDLGILTKDEIINTKPTQTDLDWWHLTKEGDFYSTAVEKKGLKRKLFNHCKLKSSVPSKTLTSKIDACNHYKECRKLTFREWKRLGSFPDDYQAKTDNIGKYIIGMSVPPKMMFEVAKTVRDQWLL
jgi:DNA (cytosine-5)-methyltransferase 1